MSENIGYATLSIIPNALGFGASLSKGIAPQMAAAGATGGAGMLGALKKAMPVVAVVAAVGGLFAIGKVFDVMTDTIRVGTGASGAALDALTESAKNVGRNSASSFADIGTAIAGISSRTGQTGPALEGLTRQILLMTKLTGGDLSTNIAGVTRVFGDWSIATGKQSKAADFLFKVHQATGASIDSLSEKVVQFGAPLRQLGFTFEQSAVLLGKWEKEGVNTGTVLAGMKIGLGAMSKAGKEPVQALKDVQAAIAGAGSAGAANLIAIKTFGQRAGPDMAAAIREGRFDLTALMGTIKGSKETILGAATATSSFSGKWQKFKNNVLIAIQPIAKKVFDAFGSGMQFMNDTGLPALQKFGTALSAKVGPALAAFGVFVTGTVVPGVQALIAAFQAGGSDVTSSGFAGGMERIGLAARVTFDWIANTGIPAVKSFASWITETAVPALVSFRDWMEKNTTTVKVIAGVITGILIPGLIHWGVQSTISAAKSVAAWFATETSSIRAGVAHVTAGWAIVASWARSAAAAIASGAETVAIWALYKIEAIKGAASVVGAHLAIVGGWIATAASAVAAGVSTAATWVAMRARSIAGAAIAIGALIAVGAGWVASAATATASGIAMAAAWVVGLGPIAWIIAAVVAIGAALILAYQKVDWFRTAVDAVWQWMKDAAVAVKDWIVGAWNAVIDFFGGLPAKFAAFGQTILSGLMTVFSWTPLGLIVNNWDAIVGFFSGLPARIGSAVSGMWDGITNSFKGVINTLIRWWNDFHLELKIPSNAVTDFMHLSGQGFTVDTPNIPMLAQGGIVPATPGGRLVRVAEGGRDEAIVPLPRNGTAGVGGPQIIQNVYPTPGLSEQQVGIFAASQLQWAMRGQMA